MLTSSEELFLSFPVAESTPNRVVQKTGCIKCKGWIVATDHVLLILKAFHLSAERLKGREHLQDAKSMSSDLETHKCSLLESKQTQYHSVTSVRYFVALDDQVMWRAASPVCCSLDLWGCDSETAVIASLQYVPIIIGGWRLKHGMAASWQHAHFLKLWNMPIPFVDAV